MDVNQAAISSSEAAASRAESPSNGLRNILPARLEK
jgi:hypothetical protein